jgi:hypothetical protein
VIRPPIILRTPTLRQFCASYVLEAAPDGCVVEFKEPKRPLEANAAMWAKLTDISNNVVWYGKKLSAEDWKTVLTASLRQTRVVPTIDGDGFVPLGMSTSKMSAKEMGALLDLIDAFAAQQGIVFTARRDQTEAVSNGR